MEKICILCGKDPEFNPEIDLETKIIDEECEIYPYGHQECKQVFDKLKLTSIPKRCHVCNKIGPFKEPYFTKIGIFCSPVCFYNRDIFNDQS